MWWKREGRKKRVFFLRLTLFFLSLSAGANEKMIFNLFSFFLPLLFLSPPPPPQPPPPPPNFFFLPAKESISLFFPYKQGKKKIPRAAAAIYPLSSEGKKGPKKNEKQNCVSLLSLSFSLSQSLSLIFDHLHEEAEAKKTTKITQSISRGRGSTCRWSRR